MPYGPANFQSTVVKPYYTEEAPKDNNDQPNDDQLHNDQPQDYDNTIPTTKDIELITTSNEKA